MNKDTGYPATLAECREAAKLCTYQAHTEFASHTEIPLLDESGAPEWSFIQGLPSIKVNEVSYLLSLFGGNLSLGPRFDRITRTIQALQADGQLPSDAQHIAIAGFVEIAEVAGVVLPEQWRQPISASESKPLTVFKKVLRGEFVDALLEQGELIPIGTLPNAAALIGCIESAAPGSYPTCRELDEVKSTENNPIYLRNSDTLARYFRDLKPWEDAACSGLFINPVMTG